MNTCISMRKENIKYPRSLQSRSGWVRFLELNRTKEPHLHQIEPTNACPYQCVQCPRSNKMKRKIGFMDMGLYKKVISEVSGYSEIVKAKEIELFHFGESLLHPQIAEMVGFASSLDLKITMSVNGPEMKPELMYEILENQPYKIIVSLDGYDDESYKKIRGKQADFEKAVSNIQRTAEFHRKSNSKTILIIRMIEFNYNKDHTEQFRRKWEDEGLQVEIRQFFPWGEKEMVELGEYVKYPPFMPCPFPWRYLVVQWDGTVVPCCRDYNSVNAVGNVRDNTLLEIWNGEKEKLIRHQLATGEFGNNDFCRKCMDIYYTEE